MSVSDVDKIDVYANKVAAIPSGSKTGSGTYNLNMVLLPNNGGFNIHQEFGDRIRYWFYGSEINSLSMLATIDDVGEEFTFELDNDGQYTIMRNHYGDGYADENASGYNLSSSLSCSRTFTITSITVNANNQTIDYGTEFAGVIGTFLRPIPQGGGSMTPHSIKEAWESQYRFNNYVVIDYMNYIMGGYGFEIMFNDGSTLSGTAGGGSVSIYYQGTQIEHYQCPQKIYMGGGYITEIRKDGSSGYEQEVMDDIEILITPLP